MFEDDDDFSFIDEDFLNDALQHEGNGLTTTSKVPRSTCIKHETSPNKEKCTNSNKNVLVKNSKDILKGQSIKCGSEALINSVKNNKNLNSGEGNSSDKCKTGGLFDSPEFDNFFDCFDDKYDAFDVESTPQDSDIIASSSTSKENDKVQHVFRDMQSTSEKASAHKTTDFRSRILQSLQGSKTSAHKKQECHSFNSNNKYSLNSFSIGERKRRGDHEDTFISKKIQVEMDSELDSQSFSSFFTPMKESKTPSPLVRKSVSPGGPVIQKRKFPGPAGILPQLGSKSSIPNVQQLHESDPSSSDAKAIVCSQSSADDFARGPWQQMMNDLEKEDQMHQTSPLSVFNIKWLLRRADLRGVAGVRKIPLLSVMVRNIDSSFVDATVQLRDKTGEMSGTISNTVFEDYGHCLHPGCVLLLKDVTLLSPVSLKALVGGREPTRRHYLNITLNTILTIYSSDESGHVITTAVCEFDKEELFNKAAALRRTTAPRAIVEEEEEEVHTDNEAPQQSLFTNLNDSYGMTTIHQNKQAHRNSYRMPVTVNNSSPRPNVAMPQQPVRYKPPVNSNPRIGNPSTQFSPRMGIPSVLFAPRMGMTSTPFTPRMGNPSSPFSPRMGTTNGCLRPQRFLPPPCQQKPVTSSFSQNTFRPPLRQPLSNVSSTCGKTNPLISQGNSKFICSQQEEKEVSDLLQSVDTDSLFGDF